MPSTLTTELENDVIFGVYPPGSRIIEDRVMERYGAKRHSVRNAFSELEARGLLVRRPNRGVEVVDFTPDEVDALYDVRIILETAAAERTKLPCDPDVAAKLDDIAHRHATATWTRSSASTLTSSRHCVERHKTHLSQPCARICQRPPRLTAPFTPVASARVPELPDAPSLLWITHC